MFETTNHLVIVVRVGPSSFQPQMCPNFPQMLKERKHPATRLRL